MLVGCVSVKLTCCPVPDRRTRLRPLDSDCTVNGVRPAVIFVPVVDAFSASYSVERTVAPRVAGVSSPVITMLSTPTSAPALAAWMPTVLWPVRSGSATVVVAQPEAAGSGTEPARDALM